MASKIPDLYSWLTERGLSLVMDTGDPARPEAPLSRKAVNACGNQWITDRLDAAARIVEPAFLPSALSLSMHCVSEHRNAAALGNSREENLSYHQNEHHGPGGLRNHPEDDLKWSSVKVQSVLREAHDE